MLMLVMRLLGQTKMRGYPDPGVVVCEKCWLLLLAGRSRAMFSRHLCVGLLADGFLLML